MRFAAGFFTAFQNCFTAFNFLFKKGLWPFLLYPLVLWIITWFLVFTGLFMLADVIGSWLNEHCNFDSIPDKGHWLSVLKPLLTGYFSVLIVWVIKILFWFISATLTKYILLIALSPLFALLSERTEQRMVGQAGAFSLGGFLKDIGRGIVISLRNMLMEYLCMMIGFVLMFFFPPLAFFISPLLLFLSWYYTGFTLIDYSCERRRMGIRESLDFVRRHKGFACGIGCMYWLWMLIPGLPGSVLGLVFGPTLCVVGATMTFVQLRRTVSEN